MTNYVFFHKTATDSLLVIFYNFRRTHFGLIRIFSKLAKRPALAQQIPTLIQLHFYIVEARLVVNGELVLAVEALFFFHQLIDMAEYRLILILGCHVSSSHPGMFPRRMREQPKKYQAVCNVVSD